LSHSFGSQAGFVNPSCCTASRQTVIDNNDRDRVNSEILSPFTCSGVLHAVDSHRTQMTGDPVHKIDSLLAQGASGSENFNGSFVRHFLSPLFVDRSSSKL
jgi:hypothetical protein